MLGAKDRFYDVLLEGAGNGSVRSILNGLQARVRMLRAASLSAPGRPGQTVAEIRALVAAIEARDADAAAAAAASHVERAAEVGLASHP
jgi:DNA-binding GntR family transcriptional regulator